MATARAKYKLAGNVQGVVVTDVDPDSPAADKNFRPGDVIVEVQSQPVKTPDDAEAQVDADAKAGKKVELMLVNRDGDLTYVGLRLDDVDPALFSTLGRRAAADRRIALLAPTCAPRVAGEAGPEDSDDCAIDLSSRDSPADKQRACKIVL